MINDFFLKSPSCDNMTRINFLDKSNKKKAHRKNPKNLFTCISDLNLANNIRNEDNYFDKINRTKMVNPFRENRYPLFTTDANIMSNILTTSNKNIKINSNNRYNNIPTSNTSSFTNSKFNYDNNENRDINSNNKDNDVEYSPQNRISKANEYDSKRIVSGCVSDLSEVIRSLNIPLSNVCRIAKLEKEKEKERERKEIINQNISLAKDNKDISEDDKSIYSSLSNLHNKISKTGKILTKNDFNIEAIDDLDISNQRSSVLLGNNNSNNNYSLSNQKPNMNNLRNSAVISSIFNDNGSSNSNYSNLTHISNDIIRKPNKSLTLKSNGLRSSEVFSKLGDQIIKNDNKPTERKSLFFNFDSNIDKNDSSNLSTNQRNINSFNNNIISSNDITRNQRSQIRKNTINAKYLPSSNQVIFENENTSDNLISNDNISIPNKVSFKSINNINSSASIKTNISVDPIVQEQQRLMKIIVDDDQQYLNLLRERTVIDERNYESQKLLKEIYDNNLKREEIVRRNNFKEYF